MIEMPNVPATRARVPWGTVRVRETLAIRTAPQELAALYLDYPNWSRVFPATIRGVRWIGDDGRDITVEVDHRMRRFVLEPMRDAAEPERPRRKSRPRRAEARPERPRVRRR